MDKKKILTIFAVFLLCVLIVAIFFVLFFMDFSYQANVNMNNDPKSVDKIVNNKDNADRDNGEVIEINEPKDNQETKRDGSYKALELAKIFTERYGSYSNHSNFSNLSDLEMFVTDDFQKEIDKITSEDDFSSSYGDYVGFLTKVLSAEQRECGDHYCSVDLKTQRRKETNDGEESEVFYHDIKVGLKKIEGSWKVDSAKWD